MTRLLLSAIVVGGGLLTAARLHAFSSDAALWASAQPSNAPRVSVNSAAVLIGQQQFELAAQMGLHAIALADRPASAYEREAVRAIVQRQLRLIDSWLPVCSRPDYSPHC